MKKTLILLALSTGLCVTLNSCQSTDSDGFFSDETATPINEYEMADGEIPVWLLDDNDVPAGNTSHTVADRNRYPIPEPTASTGRSSTGQVQPDTGLANNDATIVEPGVSTTGSDVTVPSVGPSPKPTTETTTKPKPTNNRRAATNRANSGKQQRTSKFDEPTMIVYKVKEGDNLSVIAKRCNTTVAQIRRDSGIKGDLIHPGQKIRIRYVPDGYKPGKKSSNRNRSTSHTVKSGETISGIASKYGVGYKQILKANKMTEADARRLRPGRKLTIPAKSR